MKEKIIRVLQVNKLYYPYTGGIEQIVKQIAEGLNARTNMTIFVCSEKGKAVREIVNGVVVYRAASFGKWGNLPIPKHFIRDFRKLALDKDIVLIHMPFPFADLGCLLSGYRGKVVVWWHSEIVRQKKMMFFYRPVMQMLLKRADAIIVATAGHINGSDSLKKYRKKCIVIPFGIDPHIKKRADEYWIKNEKRQYKKQQKTVQFLFVGRLVYYKGCDILLQAFQEISDRAELTVVGDGEMKQKLIAYVKSAGISQSVRFLGNINEEELCTQYEQCDVLVLPSVAKSEAFGLVQIEAMAFGKPVINTKLNSGVPFVSLDGFTGLTIEPGDPHALAEAMKFLIINEQERLLMGKNARERVNQEYTEEKMLERLMKVYQKLMIKKER